jgi:uncharacterized membrane protein YtjA (UPF0391 family)
MTRYAIAFFIIAIAAATLGFGGIAVKVSYIAQIVFYVSLPFFVISSMFVALLYKKHLVEKNALLESKHDQH